MKIIFSEGRFSSKEIFFLVFLLYAFALPFRINFSNLVLGALVVSSLLHKDFFRDLKSGLKGSAFWIAILYYFLHLLFLINTQNLREGFFLLEKELSFLVFPIIVAGNISRLDLKKINSILLAFTAGIAATTLYLTCLLFYLKQNRPGLETEYFFREEAYKYIQLHPSYMAMYAAMGVFICINNLYEAGYGSKIKIFCSLAFAILFLVIPFTGARTPIAAFFIVMIFILLLQVKNTSYRWLITISVLVIVPLCLYFSFKIPVIANRFKELSETKLAPPEGIHFNSTNLRVAQLLCTREILARNWISGTGPGDTQDELNNCYRSHGWSPALYERSYNTHNQYFQTWLTLGIAGLTTLLSLLFICMKDAVMKNDKLFISFLVLFALCCLTESMFEKNKGVIFFSCFLMLLFLRNKKIKNDNTINKSTN